MKKRMMMVLSAAVAAGVFSGCADTSVEIPFTATNTAGDCAKIEKDLAKVNDFIARISAMPASQVEEYIAALPAPGMTNSTEKRPVLRDARAKKERLTARQQQLGCAVSNSR